MVRLLLTLATGVVTWLLVASGTYYLACLFYPPRTDDGHPLMPLGQAALGLFFGTIASIVAMIAVWLWAKRWCKRRRERQIAEIAAGRSMSIR